MTLISNQVPKKMLNRRLKRRYFLAIILLSAIIAELFFIGMPSDPKIEVSSDKTTYLQGEPIAFNVYVMNPYPWRVFVASNEAFWGVENVSYAGLIADFAPWSWFSFPPLSKNIFYTYNWDQTITESSNKTYTHNQVPAGNYTFFYSLGKSVVGRCTIEIKSAAT
jgi:hypothetical protein